MFRELFVWILSSMSSCFLVLKNFVLDSSVGITLFHFFIAIIFIRLSIRIVDILKQVEETEKQDSSDFKKERGYRK